MTHYYRPLCQTDPCRPADALPLAGGAVWANRFEVLSRNTAPDVCTTADLPCDLRHRLHAARAPIAGLDLTRPSVMGILNTTPDSFSDGGMFDAMDAGVAGARAMVAAGADILDIGGESTRPGATEVDIPTEITRTAPVIAALRGQGVVTPISIDTRKSAVAEAAFEAGATVLNDVSGFDFDPDMAGWAAQTRAPVCLMHAQGTPETMQDDPTYGDVVLDVYDALEARVRRAEAAGLARDQIIVDPGIGFGKTLDHNLQLLRSLSILHGLGCAILLGASRKRFIGTISGAQEARARMPGSLAVALGAVAQGVQIIRVHDVPETVQALKLWRATALGDIQNG